MGSQMGCQGGSSHEQTLDQKLRSADRRWYPGGRPLNGVLSQQGMEAMKAAISHWSHASSPSSCIQEAHGALRHTLCSPHGMAIRRAQMGCQMGCQQGQLMGKTPI